MLKLLFELMTDPLGLPLVWYWDMIIMTVIGSVAFIIGWNISPGGRFGSLIHWTVRFVAFVVLWALVYGLIAAVRWIWANWVLVLVIIGGLAIFLIVSIFAVRYKRNRKQQEVNVDASNEG